MLTKQELNKVFSWQPYRPDWPVIRDHIDDGIKLYYGKFIESITHNSIFDAYYSEDGGMGNYLEFVCYPKDFSNGEGNAILVCVSLCSPIAAYGQTTFYKSNSMFGCGGMFKPEDIGIISDERLHKAKIQIEQTILNNNLIVLDKEFACRKLPPDLSEYLEKENNNEGSQYLHGIFQKSD